MAPLKDLSFCCTGMPMEKRLDIETKLIEMGASFFNDLMSHVNFLIVEDYQTPKYAYCIENRSDVTFLLPDCVDSMYIQYKAGEDIDIKNYILPIFYHLTICLSHIKTDDTIEVEETTLGDMKRLISENGGKASPTLAKSDKVFLTNVKTGRRYEKAVEWEIPRVHPRFVFDSMKRKAMMNIDDYKLENYPHFPHVNTPNDTTSSTAKSRVQSLQPHPDLKIKPKPQVWNSIMSTRERPKRTLPFEEIGEEDESIDEAPKKQLPNIFVGLSFTLLKFTPQQTSILTNIIKKNGGKIVSSKANYTLVPFAVDSVPEDVDGTIKTEWFIERSIYYGEVKDDEWSDPIPLLNNFKQFQICLSGFKGVEQLHITKLCELVGFKISEKFNSSIQLLIINIEIFKKNLPSNLFYNDKTKCSYNSISYISTKNKIIAAKKWKIPILSINYIFEMIQNNHHELINFPNIKDLRWCLYYPSECTNDLVSYVNSQKSQSSDSFNLPSPKKRQKSFGKLVTNTKVDYKQLESNSINTDIIDDLNFDLDIGYESKKPRLE